MRYLSIALAILVTSIVGLQNATIRLHSFTEPIDALSVGVEQDIIHLSVSALTNEGWTVWQPLEIEKEFDPLLRESNMVIFPQSVAKIRLRGTTRSYTLHPVRVSKEPVHYSVAALGSVRRPRLLSRRQWGADESFTYVGAAVSRSDEPSADVQTESYNTNPQRVRDCEDAQRNVPEEFRTVRTVTKDPSEKEYRWPRRYSPEIRQLVVHHSAQMVTGDKRPAVERMRALYAYHANSRGWGDIGYHYIIDENGQMYEGRAGGDYVVGGHVYCGNVGTIGVMMMGNFEVEKPTYAQTSSLQWLLGELAEKYNLDLATSAIFHGKEMPVIVGHGDLIATECPGYYVRETMGNIRRNVQTGNYAAEISYPTIATPKTARKTILATTFLRPVGSTELTGRPGGLLHISLEYTPQTGMQRRGRIATVTRSHSTIGIWQDVGESYNRVRKEIVAPEHIRSGDTEMIRLRIQLPRQSGLYTVDIGPITYIFKAEGRRAPSPKTGSVPQSYSPAAKQMQQTPGYRRTSAEQQATVSTLNERAVGSGQSNDTIRIRLSYTGESAIVQGPSGRFTFVQKGNACQLLNGDGIVDSGVVRLDADTGIQTISSWPRSTNRFRGILECRVLDGNLVLINELPLEDYMAGLSEEPDSEPLEKQKAFAVAARSYAAFYLDGGHRKFPGLPYDGSDTGAAFQEYGGEVFERSNPQWVAAVHQTANVVLKQDGQIVKAAYFSSDDGRTRSPEENGWQNFPFAEVFRSKPDPWCKGLPLRGHGVGMSGCGARGQAKSGKSAEEILEYYYPGTQLQTMQ